MIANDMGIAIVMEKTVKNLLKENTVILPISPTKESYLAFTRKIGEHSLASDTFWEYLKTRRELGPSFSVYQSIKKESDS